MTVVMVPAVDVVSLPLTVNLDLYQGDDFTLLLTVTDQAGNPIDMTGWTAAAVIRSAPGTLVIADFTCTISVNVITVSLPNTESINLQRKGVWDCQVTNLAGQVTTLVAGTVTASLEVTKVTDPFPS